MMLPNRTNRGDENRRRGWPAVIRTALVIQLVIVAGAVAFWYHERSIGTVPETEIVQFSAPVHGPVALESALPLALATAKRWNPRAELFNVSQQLDWSLTATDKNGNDAPGGGWLVFVFVAPQHRMGEVDTAASLSILIDRDSGNVVSAQPLSWKAMPAVPDLTLGDYKVNSTMATTIAEDVAGRAFRHACANVRHVSWLNLLATNPRQPVWLVTYQDTRNTDTNGLVVRIDALTGKVISHVNQAPACGT